MDFLFKLNSGDQGAFGDIGTYFRNAQKYISNNQTELLKEISKVDFSATTIFERDSVE